MDWASLFAGFLQWSQEMIASFGYLGVFVVSFVSTATIFLPAPGFLFIIAASAFLNPLLVAVVSAAGMALGELTGFFIGKGGGRVLDRKEKKWLKKGEKWFQEGKGFLFIMLFAATPLPDDITGIVGGMFSYDLKKFLLASFLGKLLMNTALAFAGFYGFSFFLGGV